MGLVQLMGRHSGSIACYAALANREADFVLIPEVPFRLDGSEGLLAALHRRGGERRQPRRGGGRGAGQGLLDESGGTDPSGNRALGDIGLHVLRASPSTSANGARP